MVSRVAALCVLLLAAHVSAIALSRDRRGLTLAVSSSSADVKNSQKSPEFDMQVEVQAQQVQVETKRETSSGEEQLDFELDVSGYPKLELEAELENDGSETKDKLRLEFRRLVRFDPTDLSAGYQNEAVLEEYDLDTAEFAALSCTQPTGAATGAFACVATTTDNVFKLKFTFAGNSFVKNGETVSPKQAKIEIVVNMPIGAHPATSAVMLEVMMRTKTKYEPKEGSSEVDFGGAAIFEWETFFTDELAATYPVVAGQYAADTVDNGDEGEDDEDIVKTFTFAKAGVTSVNWDPVFGASGSSSSSSSLSSTQTIAVGAGVAVLVAIVVVVAVVIMKRKN